MYRIETLCHGEKCNEDEFHDRRVEKADRQEAHRKSDGGDGGLPQPKNSEQERGLVEVPEYDHLQPHEGPKKHDEERAPNDELNPAPWHVEHDEESAEHDNGDPGDDEKYTEVVEVRLDDLR